MSIYGAVYQINNDPNDNRVLVYKILRDGTLNFSTSVTTSGRGTSVRKSDPFFSQGPVIVFNQSLFVVNAGSNSLTMFNINPQDPTQLTFQTAIGTNGDYPVSITVNSQYVAVLNGGTRSGFRVFAWDPNGTLTPIPNWDRSIPLNPPQSTPPVGPPNTVSQIMFSPDDKSLLVAYKGISTTQPGVVLTYPINNGALTPNPIKNIIQSQYLPFSMICIDDNGLLLTDASKGVNATFYDSWTGQLSVKQVRSLQISGAVCWSAYSSKTGNYYVIGAVSGNVSEIKVDPVTLQPQLVNTYPLGMKSESADAQVATVDNVDYLYVNTPGTQGVNVLRLDGPGHATLLSPLTLPSNLASPAVAGLATISMSDHNDHMDMMDLVDRVLLGDESTLHQLPVKLLHQIILDYLTGEDVIRLCDTSQYFNEVVCSDQYLWKELYRRDFYRAYSQGTDISEP